MWYTSINAGGIRRCLFFRKDYDSAMQKFHANNTSDTKCCVSSRVSQIHSGRLFDTRSIPFSALILLLALSLAMMPMQARAAVDLDSAASALQLLKAGDVRNASKILSQALNSDPTNTLLRDSMGCLLMLTGSNNDAAAQWKSALSGDSKDALAQYGLGLVALAQGNRTQAAAQFKKAEGMGNPASILLAERYTDSLMNSSGTGAGLNLPDEYMASILALNGMSALGSGDAKHAIDSLTSSMDDLKGDPLSEPMGVLMTFDRQSPLKDGMDELSSLVIRPDTNPAGGHPLSGYVTFVPDYVDADTGYVIFKVDGAFASMSNNPPYRFTWNTARVKNGSHTIDVLLYDQHGSQINASQKIVNVNNPLVVHVTPGEEIASRNDIRAGYWKLMTLLPSRMVLAYSAASAARTLGEPMITRKYLEITAGIDPDYRDTRLQYSYMIAGQAGASLWRGARNDRAIALTFDDGPKPGITEQLLAILQREKAPGTFFVIGRHVTAFPDLSRQIHDAGMEMECHSYTHPNLTKIPLKQAEEELMRTVAAIRSASGENTRFFRPPGGDINSRIVQMAAKWGLTPCMWTVDGEKMEKTTPQELISWMLPRVVPGSIVLLHNGRQNTVDALPALIKGLRARGFTFVTVQELAQRLNASRELTGRENGTGHLAR
jgi:peptidoglycan/xylan/chitin deacetylase (PgdA/CDA1 family)